MALQRMAARPRVCAAAGLAIGLTAAGFTNNGGRSWEIATAARAQPRATETPPVAVAPAPAAAPPSPAAPAPKQEWGSFPTMLLEKIYRGPLRDTIIQRWRDPIDGSVCAVYMPISAPLLPPTAEGYVRYGASQIGSVSCIHPTQVLQLWQGGGAPPVAGLHEPAEAPARKAK
jgi:hypothetical protein